MSIATKETEYTPVVVQGHNYADVSKGDGMSPMIRGEKQGHKCCGSCCDVRRAVIVVNMLNVQVFLLGLFFMIVFQMASDDTEKTQNEVVYMIFGSFILICAVPAVFGAVGIAGALLYNKWMVGIAGAFFCQLMIFSVVNWNIFGVVVMGLFAYPHYFLVKEINQGIIVANTRKPPRRDRA